MKQYVIERDLPGVGSLMREGVAPRHAPNQSNGLRRLAGVATARR